MIFNCGCWNQRSGPVFTETGTGIFSIKDKDKMSLTIDSNTGGRMVSVIVNGHELLTQQSINKYAFGSTFWPSPHFSGWPLPADYDRTVWRAEISKNQIQLTGPVIESLGLQFRKKIRFVPKENSLYCCHVIYNRTDSIINVAPWEVTRVDRKGRWFTPAENNAFNTKNTLKDISVDFSSGIYHCDIPDNYLGKSQKISLNASEGWFLFLSDQLVFLKLFDDIDESDLAPKAGDVEFYIDGNTAYMEMETQGRYGPLAPGDSLFYHTRWIIMAREKVFNSEEEITTEKITDFVSSITKKDYFRHKLMIH